MTTHDLDTLHAAAARVITAQRTEQVHAGTDEHQEHLAELVAARRDLAMLCTPHAVLAVTAELRARRAYRLEYSA